MAAIAIAEVSKVKGQGVRPYSSFYYKTEVCFMPAPCPAHILVMIEKLFSGQKHTEIKGENIKEHTAVDTAQIKKTRYILKARYVEFISQHFSAKGVAALWCQKVSLVIRTINNFTPLRSETNSYYYLDESLINTSFIS